MGSIARLTRVATASSLLVLIAIAAAPRRVAAGFVPCSAVDLINAVQAAVTAGGPQTIDLSPACTYTLTAVHSGAGLVEASGLPYINNMTTAPVVLTINGNGATITRAGGAPQFRFFLIFQNNTLTLNNLTLSGGKALDNAAPGGATGGAIANGGTLTLSGVTLTGNTAGHGFGTGSTGGSGGALSNSGSATIVSSTISNNTAGDGGGTGATPGIGGFGGGIVNFGTLEITSSLLNNNTAGNGGMGMGGAGAAGGAGGAISNGGMLTILASIINGNVAGDGGASTTSTGGSGAAGGGIANTVGSTLTLSSSRVSNNTAGDGGSGQTGGAAGGGGGIFNQGTMATVTGTTINGNAAGNGGNGTTTGGSGGNGGGIFVLGTTTLANSTISANVAGNPGSGGAPAAGGGGGLYSAGFNFNVTNCTVTGNGADMGGGIRVPAAGIPQLRNTIVANNSPGGNCAGSIGNINNNLDSGTTCGFTAANGSISNGNANLGPLQDNGGFTSTHALLDPSAAIDAGNDAVCAAAPVSGGDQRGVARPQGAHCDIGAFETGASLPTPTATLTSATAATSTSTSAVTPTPTSTATLTRTPTIASASELCVTNSSNNSVTVYSATADGNIAPLRTLIGAATGLGAPHGIDVDTAHNEMFIANFNANSVTAYDRGASGNSAPLRTISGASTLIESPQGVAVDPAHNELIVVSRSGPGSSINAKVTVYSRTANGNVEPLRTIAGPATGLDYTHGLAVDPVNNEILVANTTVPGSGAIPSIRVFSRTADGNVAPVRIITGPATGLNIPEGLALDLVNNEILIGNTGGNSILVFNRTAVGNIAPLRTITGAATNVSSPVGLAVDPASNGIAVAEFSTQSVLAFSRTANGNVAPARTIAGAATGLSAPVYIAIAGTSPLPTPTGALTATPPNTATVPPTQTSTRTLTPTSTHSPTLASTSTATLASTSTPTPLPVITATHTGAVTASQTPTRTASRTPSPTQHPSITQARTPTRTPTATASVTPTAPAGFVTLAGQVLRPRRTGTVILRGQEAVVGAVVEVSRCERNRRGVCLKTPGTPVATALTNAQGRFVLQIPVAVLDDGLLLLSVTVDGESSSKFRNLVVILQIPGAGGGAGQFDEDVIVDAVSEAGVQLLDEEGLGNFTEAGAADVLAAVDAANADANFDGLGDSAAVGMALTTAEADPAVQAAIEEHRQVACGGDCDGGSTVTVDEIIRGVNIALGTVAVDDCPAFDIDGGGAVTVDEIVTAVNHALTGCPDLDRRGRFVEEDEIRKLDFAFRFH